MNVPFNDQMYFPYPFRFYAACITLGLEAIHTKNVTHRDLKPGNLLMDEGGYLKIAEFGMSKTDIGYGDQANTMVGSPAYMAPEIVKEEEYTRAVDWWALGVIVYEMLLGTVGKKLPLAS
ncbi:serine/threonine-protein kinase N3-like [Xenopus laevis]|uniref:Serine/threonine-protein kinase N3-like n=1 Tax=Xenopus laevis TaxID=8355 RepID=A0A8J1LPS4_XENLA|nr:serine/threonine-protein kinase N3-like [Xenopus laevis]